MMNFSEVIKGVAGGKLSFDDVSSDLMFDLGSAMVRAVPNRQEVMQKMMKEAAPGSRFLIDASVRAKTIIGVSKVILQFKDQIEDILKLVLDSLESGEKIEPLLLVQKFRGGGMDALMNFLCDSNSHADAALGLLADTLFLMYASRENDSPGAGIKEVDSRTRSILIEFLRGYKEDGDDNDNDNDNDN